MLPIDRPAPALISDLIAGCVPDRASAYIYIPTDVTTNAQDVIEAAATGGGMLTCHDCRIRHRDVAP